MKSMKKLIVFVLVGIILSAGIISAMQIQFFYSESCPHCQEIFPFVKSQVNKYPSYNFFVYETSIEENQISFKNYGFTGVPSFVINTDDGREIKFSGANKPKLYCELQEMTTLECPTYSVDHCIGGSWFK